MKPHMIDTNSISTEPRFIGASYNEVNHLWFPRWSGASYPTFKINYIRMKINTTIIVLSLFLISESCISPKYLPPFYETDVNQYGSEIIVTRNSDSKIEGELIAIDSSTMTVLLDSSSIKSDTENPIVIPLTGVEKFKLNYARPKKYGWTIPVFTLATIGHGFYSLISAPVNLIVTISVTSSGATAFQYNQKDMTFEQLKMFARFPQGIPPGIEIAAIK